LWRCIEWLEDRGAVRSWRPGTESEWWLDLNEVPDMSQREANEIPSAAFEIRDAIRAVLLGRRRRADDSLMTTNALALR
jgi:hypothetical protein